MRALKIIQVNHGSLNKIPADMDKMFLDVSQLDFSFNQLKSVPDSLGKMKFTHLYLRNNELKKIPDNLWENNFIFQVALENNGITNISPAVSNAKSIGDIRLSNNSLTKLPVELFTLNLILLYVDGNQINNIPSEIGKATLLKHVKFNNNDNISIVPDEIGNLARLVDVDLRNNAIEFLPDTFQLLDKVEYAYLTGNPICKNGWIESTASKKIQDIVTKNNAGCVAQCSIYCQDAFLDDDICDAECNVKRCKYDGGDCRI
jgi:leucine-rich repeat protein SHOC2